MVAFAIQYANARYLCLRIRCCLEVFKGGLEVVSLQGCLGRLKVLQGAHNLQQCTHAWKGPAERYV